MTSQNQLNNLSSPLPVCWGGSKPGAPICDDCVQAGVEPTYYPAYMGFYSLRLSPQSDARSTISHPATASVSSSDNSVDSQSPNTFFLSQQPSSDDSRSSNISKPTNLLSEEFMNYTPSTVLESAGRTPPPMTTPPNTSFSDNLAYIDAKLLQFASNQRRGGIDAAPHFPPGLTPNYGDVGAGTRLPTLGHYTVETGQTYQAPYLLPLNASSIRRSHSKMVREEIENSSPEAWPNSSPRSHEQPETEPSTKRRKLARHDSTISAHNFVATEPASLRKAKSLVAGDIGFVPQQPVVTSVPRLQVLPIAVPTIWPQDAALVRLRNMVARETIQRTDDLKHMTASQQPSSCKFDFQMHMEAVDWILSVHAPAGDFLKPLRRHLRDALETRFHAVWLFSRYAGRLSTPGANPFLMPRHGTEAPYHRRIRARLVREVALGCLAVAAKFHHDFLPPLLPLTVDQFLELLGEDYPVTFDDFELVQNAILKSFDYIINQPTPQSYLQEMWKVCPTLQNLRDGHFEFPRSAVRVQAMELVETCLIEYEVMDHPVSSLTAAALLESLHICGLHQQCNTHSGGRWSGQEDSAEEMPPAGRVCAGCVSQEICDALQVPRHALDSCRDWMMAIWTGEN